MPSRNPPQYLIERHNITIDMHKNAINREFMCQMTMADIDKVSHLENMVSGNLHLKSFYEENEENKSLVLALYSFFESILPFWSSEVKTTGREDALLAQQAHNHIMKAIVCINKSTDLWLNSQLYWESYVRESIDLSHKGLVTEQGEVFKRLIKKLLFQTSRNRDELVDENILYNQMHFPTDGNQERTKSCIETFNRWQILEILSNLADYLDNIQEVAVEKNNVVIKANSENAHIHYTITNVKEILEKHSIPKHKHVRYLSQILMGVMKEDVQEDTIRKYLNRNTGH